MTADERRLLLKCYELLSNTRGSEIPGDEPKSKILGELREVLGKYFITEPVPGGYAYWNVREPDGPHGQNFALVTISKFCPGARSLAYEICAELNKAEGVQKTSD